MISWSGAASSAPRPGFVHSLWSKCSNPWNELELDPHINCLSLDPFFYADLSPNDHLFFFSPYPITPFSTRVMNFMYKLEIFAPSCTFWKIYKFHCNFSIKFVNFGMNCIFAHWMTQCVIWTKILTRHQDRLLIQITRPVLFSTDIQEAYNNSHWFNLSTGQVTKNVASPAQNEPVIRLEDRLLLTCWNDPIFGVHPEKDPIFWSPHWMTPFFDEILHRMPPAIVLR